MEDDRSRHSSSVGSGSGSAVRLTCLKHLEQPLNDAERGFDDGSEGALVLGSANLGLEAVGGAEGKAEGVRRALDSGVYPAQYGADTESLGLSALVGASSAMARLRCDVLRAARATTAPVLIQGESGTGKELVARALHAESERATGPFVAVNSAAVPESMVEAELFGWVRGAFTGAVQSRQGKFCAAHGGTLFLDEIGDLSAAAQAKILRAVESGEITPLGSEKPRRIDVRVVTATHRDLADLVRRGSFRADLYYRLNVVDISVPALRDRLEDIPLLARHFLTRAARQAGVAEPSFAPSALRDLTRYHWPGNVRELENSIERALVFAGDEVIGPEHLRLPLAREPQGASSVLHPYAELEASERALVTDALRASGGNLAAAARRLGISRVMVKRRIERFGIEVERVGR